MFRPFEPHVQHPWLELLAMALVAGDEDVSA